MFRTLAEVVEYCDRGAAPLPHHLVPGEQQWLRDRGRELEARVAALTAQQHARNADQQALDAKWRAENTWLAQEIENRKEDDVTRRVRDEIASQQQTVDALKAQVQETLTELRSHPKGSKERHRLDEELRQIQRDLTAAKQEVAGTRRWLTEYQQVTPPERGRTALPDVGTELALAKALLGRHQAFVALAGTEGPATDAAGQLRSTLRELAQQLKGYRTQAEALERALGSGASAELIVQQLVRQEIVDDEDLVNIAHHLGLRVE